MYLPLEMALSTTTIVNGQDKRVIVNSIHWTALKQLVSSEEAAMLYNKTLGMDFNKTVACILAYDKLVLQRKFRLEIESGENLGDLEKSLVEGKQQFEREYKPNLFEKARGIVREIKDTARGLNY